MVVTCIWIMPTVSIKPMRGPHKHMEGHIVFLKVIRNTVLGRTCAAVKSSDLDISGTILNKAQHDGLIYHKK